MGEAAQKTDKVKVVVTMASPSVSPELSEAYKLLKEATAMKKSGNIKGAVETLRASYKIMSKNSNSYPIEPYLRLPLYLQEAGEKDEAWGEFNELILWVNAKPRYSPEVTPMEQSIVWDKMRLFLQREGNNDSAVQYAVWAYVSWAVGLYMQKRNQELKAYKAKTNIQKALRAALHKADKELLTDRLTQIVVDALDNLPIVDYKRIAEAVQEEMR
jgi:hypothetical protein